MCSKLGASAFLAGFVLAAAAGAAVVFEDAFGSVDNWGVLVGSPGLSINSGLRANNATNNWHALIADASMGDAYTCRVDGEALGDGENTLGLLFSWEQGNGGYLLSVSTNGWYFVDKIVQQDSIWYDTVGNQITKHSISRFFPENLDQGWNSWINKGENSLAVSKSGADFKLACNGVLLTEISDDAFSGDSMGLLIGANSQLRFTLATVTDQSQSFSRKQYLADDFNDNDLDGWAIWANRPAVSAANGKMQFAPVDSAQRTIVYTHLNFTGSDVQFDVTHGGGLDSAFYGVVLMDFYVEYDSTYQQNITRYNAFTYYINKAGQYAAFTSNAQSFTPLETDAVTGDGDVITITKDFDFIVNGTTLKDGAEMGTPFEFDAVGLVAYSSADIAYDNFIGGDSNALPILVDRGKPAIVPVRPAFELGGTGIIYDALGRGKRVRSGARAAREALQELPSGPVYIIRKTKKKHAIRRAVIVK